MHLNHRSASRIEVSYWGSARWRGICEWLCNFAKMPGLFGDMVELPGNAITSLVSCFIFAERQRGWENKMVCWLRDRKLRCLVRVREDERRWDQCLIGPALKRSLEMCEWWRSLVGIRFWWYYRLYTLRNEKLSVYPSFCDPWGQAYLCPLNSRFNPAIPVENRLSETTNHQVSRTWLRCWVKLYLR